MLNIRGNGFSVLGEARKLMRPELNLKELAVDCGSKLIEQQEEQTEQREVARKLGALTRQHIIGLGLLKEKQYGTNSKKKVSTKSY